MKKIGLLLFSLFILFGHTITASASDTKPISFTVTYGQSEARTILKMLNEFRTGDDAWYWNSDNKTQTTCTNLSSLTYDYDLEKIAMQRAAEIALLYSHTRPDGSKAFTAYGSLSSKYTNKGENIVKTFSSAESAFTAWCEEDQDYSGQGHRRLMLSNKINAVGIGHAEFNGKDYWVMEVAYTTQKTVKTKASNKYTEVTVNVTASSYDTYYNMASTGSSMFLSFKINTLKNVKTGVKITWKKISSPDGYIIYRETGSGKYKRIAKVGSTVNTYTDTNVKSGKTYKYKVVPYSGKIKGNGVAKSITWLSCPEVQSISYTSENNYLLISWNEVKGADYYMVRFSGNKAYKGYQWFLPSDKTSLVVDELPLGKYTIKIRAFSADSDPDYVMFDIDEEDASAWSNQETVKVLNVENEYVDWTTEDY